MGVELVLALLYLYVFCSYTYGLKRKVLQRTSGRPVSWYHWLIVPYRGMEGALGVILIGFCLLLFLELLQSIMAGTGSLVLGVLVRKLEVANNICLAILLYYVSTMGRKVTTRGT